MGLGFHIYIYTYSYVKLPEGISHKNYIYIKYHRTSIKSAMSVTTGGLLDSGGHQFVRSGAPSVAMPVVSRPSG